MSKTPVAVQKGRSCVGLLLGCSGCESKSFRVEKLDVVLMNLAALMD